MLTHGLYAHLVLRKHTVNYLNLILLKEVKIIENILKYN